MFLEKDGGIGGPAGKLQLVTYDTRGDNAEAIDLTRKLINSDQVLAIIGSQFSGEAEVSFPLAVRGQTPIITPMSGKSRHYRRQQALGVSLRAHDRESVWSAAGCLG